MSRNELKRNNRLLQGAAWMSDMDKQDDQSRVMDRSFENIVIYFRHELEHITAGGRAYKVLSFRQRRQLISKGVIKFDRHSTPGSPR